MSESQLIRIKHAIQALSWPALLMILVWGINRYVVQQDKTGDKLEEIVTSVQVILKSQERYEKEQEKQGDKIQRIQEQMWQMRFSTDPENTNEPLTNHPGQ